ncbi:MAG: glycoside hydrolase family 30 protein [Prevotella sp.]|nr:glycoside hydrolase family 30 protein [Prevotella sp.]
MKTKVLLMMALALQACSQKDSIKVWETNSAGDQLVEKTEFAPAEKTVTIEVNSQEERQTLVGIGGSFTEATSSLLARLSKENRQKVIDAYFGPDGARYSLTRTHIGSCDFSHGHYSYAPEKDDTLMEHFSIAVDEETLLPLIKDAQAVSKDGFKIVSSPWSPPAWMKDNQSDIGGHLLPKYQQAFANYFAKYLEAYKAKGVDVWAVTPINEPLGNNNNWESMYFDPGYEAAFVRDYMGPTLEKAGFGDVKILGYDQNRAGIPEWTDAMYADEATSKYFGGVAIHWYESTVEWFPEMLSAGHEKAPDKLIIETEGCVDAEVPHWKDDAWYWRAEGTDWGWDWAPDDQKHLHPKYVPVFRYARDIIGCLNNWVSGWIDWNMVLDRQGGPGWAKNWCCAPVLADAETDEVYFTPMYYAMAHFSRFLRPDAKVLGVKVGGAEPTTIEEKGKAVMATAVRNPDGSLAVVVINQGSEPVGLDLAVDGKHYTLSIAKEAIQTIVI